MAPEGLDLTEEELEWLHRKSESTTLKSLEARGFYLSPWEKRKLYYALWEACWEKYSRAWADQYSKILWKRGSMPKSSPF